MLRVLVLALVAGLTLVACQSSSSDEVAPEDAERRRRTTSAQPLDRRLAADGSPVIYAPAFRLVRELDPPLPPLEPEECSVADEFRPALGCLESFPLLSGRVPRPSGSTLEVEGSLPRRLWRQPVLIEPRLRGAPLDGFKRASGQIVEVGFFGFSFPATLPELAGGDELELQVRGHVVPTAVREFATRPLAIGPGDRLAFAMALHEIAMPFATDPVEFTVLAESPSETHSLFEETIDPDTWSGNWEDRRVSLEALAGQTVRIRFRTRVLGEEGDRRGFPLWGSPEILVPTARGARRNLIVISLDTWRGDHFGGVVAGGPITPHLEARAADGAVFTRAISTYPSTSASHMSLFTGLYPITHQVRFANDVLGDSIATMADLLGANGYQTAAVTENAMLSAQTGFAFGFDSYRENKGLGIWSTEGQIDATLEHGRAWLRAHRDERFFLFLHTYQVHTPYEPPAEYLRKPTAQQKAEAAVREEPWITELRYRYAGEVRYADRVLADFLDDLRRDGILQDSIVVITSDHGEEFSEHQSMGHSKNVYDEVLRVPFLLWAPGLVPGGTRVESLFSLVDVLPTLLELLGIHSPERLHGRSFAGALTGKAEAPSGPRFAEGPDASRPGERLTAARTQDFKWIAPFGSVEPVEIYDLRADPGEQRNLDDENLRRVGRDHLRTYGGFERGDARKRELDARTTDKLRALGYID